MPSYFLFLVTKWKMRKSNCWTTSIFLELISRNYFLVFDSLLETPSRATRLFSLGDAIAAISERCWDRLGWEGGSSWELMGIRVDDPEYQGSTLAEAHHIKHVHVIKELHDATA